MDIDIEGAELSVLASNDWDRFRPSVIVVEVLDTPLFELVDNPVIRFLSRLGYKPTSRLFRSVILQR